MGRREPGSSRAKANPSYIGCDWASGKGYVLAYGDGSIVRCPTYLDVIQRVGHDTLVIETSFESYDLASHQALIDGIRAGGGDILVLSPRATPRRLMKMGLTKMIWVTDEKTGKRKQIVVPDKTDENDARAILAEVTENPAAATSPNETPDDEYIAWFTGIQTEYMEARRGDGKKEMAKAAKALLPKYRLLDPEIKEAVGNGTNYYDGLLAPLWFALRHTRNRDMMERLLGFSQHAYPSIMRSETHFWTYRFLRQRGVTMSQYRRGARRLFSMMKAGHKPTQP